MSTLYATITLADPGLIAEIGSANGIIATTTDETTTCVVAFPDAVVTFTAPIAAPTCGDIGEPVREVEFEPFPTTAPIEEPAPIREPERTPA